MKMKLSNISLLVLIRDYPVGLAVTKKIQNILDYLKRYDIEISVLSYRSKIPQTEIKGEKDGISYLSIGNNLRLHHLRKTVIYLVKGISYISRNRKKHHNNVFYCIGPVNIENLLFVTWARVLHYKILFDINEDYSFFEDNVKAISKFKIQTTRKLDNITSRWGDAITVVSSHLKRKYAFKTKKPVTLIPVTAKENYKEKKASANKKYKIVYAGTFDIKDGVDTIIGGFTIFNREFKDAELILMGKSEQQETYVMKYKDVSNIKFMGYVPDEHFYEVLRNADVLCMCRTNSGFSNAGFPFKLGEYLATGNPVIATRASDVCDYLSSGDAYLVDFENPEEVADAMKSIINNPLEARRVGLNGFKKYEQFFSPEANGKLMVELLQRL